MKCTKETIKKAVRTFVQTALGYAAVNIALINFSAEKALLKQALTGLAISAVSAGLSAAMNLEKKENCKK